MLEALIRKKESGGLDKFQGDVICVKLKELSDWGATEIRVHKVVEWQDEELENSMREELAIRGASPVRITPYKILEKCEILDDKGQSIYNGDVTKTRSSKYFNIDSGKQEEKSAERIQKEFELNKRKLKEDILKDKPAVKQENKSISDDEKQILDKYVEALKSIGVTSDVVDGGIKILNKG